MQHFSSLSRFYAIRLLFGIINFYADLLRICCCGYERCALMSSEQKITVYSSNYAIINSDYISSTHNTLSKDKVKYKNEMLPSLPTVKWLKRTGQQNNINQIR